MNIRFFKLGILTVVFTSSSSFTVRPAVFSSTTASMIVFSSLPFEFACSITMLACCCGAFWLFILLLPPPHDVGCGHRWRHDSSEMVIPASLDIEKLCTLATHMVTIIATVTEPNLIISQVESILFPRGKETVWRNHENNCWAVVQDSPDDYDKEEELLW